MRAWPLLSSTPGDVYRFPAAGTTRMTKLDGTSITNTTPRTLFSAAAGTQGVLKRLALIQALTADAMDKVWLCAYHGGRTSEGTLQTQILAGDAMPKVVTTSFNPTGMVDGQWCLIGQEVFTATYLSSTSITLTARAQRGSTAVQHNVGKALKLPDWGVPLAKVPGLGWSPAAGIIDASSGRTPFGEVLLGPTAPDVYWFYSLDYEMPYPNGLKVTMHAISDLGAADAGVFGAVYYQDRLPASPFRQHRLRFDCSSQAGVVPAARHTIVTRSGKAGYLVAVSMTATMVTPANADFMEAGNPRIFVDGEGAASWQWAGTEDLFNDGFFLTARKRGNMSGCTAADNGFHAYLMLDRHPVSYKTSLVMDVLNGGSENVDFSWVTAVYEKA